MMFGTPTVLDRRTQGDKGDFVPFWRRTTRWPANPDRHYTGATTIALTRTSTRNLNSLAQAPRMSTATEKSTVGRLCDPNGQGARVAFDPVGAGFPKLISALACGGIIYIYALLAPCHPTAVLNDRARDAHQGATNSRSLVVEEPTGKPRSSCHQCLQAGALKPSSTVSFTFDGCDVHR